jgi:hypothetical protein
MVCLENTLQYNPHVYCSEKTTEENWTAVKSSIISAAKASIGRGRRRQPEWFEDNSETTTPLID